MTTANARSSPNFLQVFPNFSSSFPRLWSSFPSLSSSFSKDSFGGFVEFQGLIRQKKPFSSTPHFWPRGGGLSPEGSAERGFLVEGKGRTFERRGGGKPETIIAQMRVFGNRILTLPALTIKPAAGRDARVFLANRPNVKPGQDHAGFSGATGERVNQQLTRGRASGHLPKNRSSSDLHSGSAVILTRASSIGRLSALCSGSAIAI